MLKFVDLFKNALALREKMQEIESALRKERVEASSGGDLVRVIADGQQNILQVQIDPDLFASGDKKLIEDLVVAALNEVRKKSLAVASEQFKKTLGNLPISPEELGPLLHS